MIHHNFSVTYVYFQDYLMQLRSRHYSNYFYILFKAFHKIFSKITEIINIVIVVNNIILNYLNYLQT